MIVFSSCATRPLVDLPAATDFSSLESATNVPKRDSTAPENDSVAELPGSSRIDSDMAVVAPPTDRSRRGGKPSSVPTPPGLEEWMAAQLGAGVTVNRTSSGTLVVSRTKTAREPLPLFEEAIVLGELRAVVRSSGERQKGSVAFRNGVASLTIETPLRSRSAVRTILKILEFPEVSEVHVSEVLE